MKLYLGSIIVIFGLFSISAAAQPVYAGTCNNFNDSFSGSSLDPVYNPYMNPAGTSAVVDAGKLTLNADGYSYGNQQGYYLFGPELDGDIDFDLEVDASDLAHTNLEEGSTIGYTLGLNNLSHSSYELAVAYFHDSGVYIVSFRGMTNDGFESLYTIPATTISNVKLKLSKVGKSIKAYYDYAGTGYKYLDEAPIADAFYQYGGNLGLSILTSEVDTDTTASIKFDNLKVTCKTNSTVTSNSAIYRFKNRRNGKYFFTINNKEKSKLQAGSEWAYEKVAYNAFPRNNAGSCSSGIPMFRFYSDVYRSHFFTTNEKEKTKLITTDPNWRYEGIGYCVLANPLSETRKSVYRLYSTALKTHMYTTSTTERNSLKSKGWTDEGIKFYAHR